MVLLKQTGKFGVTAISAIGGITHNLGQILTAVLVVENANLLYYFPTLLLAGVITGVLIGMTAQEILFRLPKEKFF